MAWTAGNIYCLLTCGCRNGSDCRKLCIYLALVEVARTVGDSERIRHAAVRHRDKVGLHKVRICWYVRISESAGHCNFCKMIVVFKILNFSKYLHCLSQMVGLWPRISLHDLTVLHEGKQTTVWRHCFRKLISAKHRTTTKYRGNCLAISWSCRKRHRIAGLSRTIMSTDCLAVVSFRSWRTPRSSRVRVRRVRWKRSNMPSGSQAPVSKV